MNRADSEKIHMILFSAGLRKVIDPLEADIIIVNTCSVRQKGEDRVFGFIHAVILAHKKNGVHKLPLFGVTGCMVRKTGIARRFFHKSEKESIRHNSHHITSLANLDSLENNDDPLFLRSDEIDFTFRIEEVSYLTKILTWIMHEDIGNDAKFYEYLQVKQIPENPAFSNIIIQTWCDNYCSFCIVPYTRGREVCRPQEEILQEVRRAVDHGAREITLLGQNVNSYGKETKQKLWNIDELKWNITEKCNGMNLAFDIDSVIIQVWWKKILEEYNTRFSNNLEYKDLVQYHFNGDKNLKEVFYRHFYSPHNTFELFPWAVSILQKLKQQGHNLYLVTSRPLTDKELTHNWAKKVFPENFFCDILFTSEYWDDDKGSIADMFHFDLVVDDAPHHIASYVSSLTRATVIYSQPWNQEIQHWWNVYRANWWYEVEKICRSLNILPPATPFRELLEEINCIDGLDRIRFTSSNPHDMTKDILDAHFELEKLCPYLHFALQSWSNSLLKKMHRKHTYEDFLSQVRYLRSKDPLFSISTDIIVWFPTETEQEFAETVRAMQECEFDFAYIARYSPRVWTRSHQMEDTVTPAEKARRWGVLNSLLRESVQKRSAMMIGKTEPVLIAWFDTKGNAFGRTRNFKEVYFPHEGRNIWEIVHVTLMQLEGWNLLWKQQ